jgi:hypothetical protein
VFEEIMARSRRVERQLDVRLLIGRFQDRLQHVEEANPFASGS